MDNDNWGAQSEMVCADLLESDRIAAILERGAALEKKLDHILLMVEGLETRLLAQFTEVADILAEIEARMAEKDTWYRQD